MAHSGRARLSLLIVLAVVFLRVVIGVHFVREGEKKMHGDYWTAGGFFGAATGPFAPLFHGLVNDFDGKKRLCFDADAEGPDRINMEPTLKAWGNYKEQVARHYGFGDPEVEAIIAAERKKNRAVLVALEENAAAGELSEGEQNELTVARQREHDLRTEIETLRSQNEQADQILATSIESFEYFVDSNNEDINNYFNGWESRRRGFLRDGTQKRKVVAEVESLTYQQDVIYGELVNARSPWLAEIDASWNSLEQQLNALALPRQQSPNRPKNGVEVALIKPNQKTFMLTMVDTCVPYFDMSVGILLILGLFTRYVGVIGAGFLSLVVVTQLPGVPGAQDSIAQIIEMGSLLVLAAVGAGRYGGLDYFVEYFSGKGTRGNEVGTHESLA